MEGSVGRTRVTFCAEKPGTKRRGGRRSAGPQILTAHEKLGGAAGTSLRAVRQKFYAGPLVRRSWIKVVRRSSNKRGALCHFCLHLRHCLSHAVLSICRRCPSVKTAEHHQHIDTTSATSRPFAPFWRDPDTGNRPAPLVTAHHIDFPSRPEQEMPHIALALGRGLSLPSLENSHKFRIVFRISSSDHWTKLRPLSIRSLMLYSKVPRILLSYVISLLFLAAKGWR